MQLKIENLKWKTFLKSFQLFPDRFPLGRKSGEGYVDTAIGILALMAVLVAAINIFSFLTLRQDLDEVCEQLIETATYTGAFGGDFNDRRDDLSEQFFDFTVKTAAAEYYNAAYKRVQLGDTMSVTVSVQTYVRGFGLFRIPLTVSCTRSGISEKYWK